MDPFNVVARSTRQVYFLANASLFKHPLANRILSTLYCIRVERYQDVDGRAVQNEKAFAHSIAFLKRGGCLYVAPEGTSEVERHLRKIKTGTARIALAAEAANNFQLGVRIIPTGINYSDPTAFRSDVVVEAGPPILVSDFREQYLRDEWEGVTALTLAIRHGLEKQMVHTFDTSEDEALRALEAVSHTENPVRLRRQPGRSRLLLKVLRDQGVKTPELQTYHQFLFRNRLSDEAVAGKGPGFFQMLLLIVGAPLALFGWINHLLPCCVPWLLNRRFNVWPCYDATYKYVAGLVFLPLFYALQISLVAKWTDWGWLYAGALPLSGLWTDYSLRQLRRLQAVSRWKKIRLKLPEQAALMTDLRTSFIPILPSKQADE